MLFGCNLFDETTGGNNPPTPPVTGPTWDTVTEGQLIERPRVNEGGIVELLGDLNFSKGFSVTLFHANSSNGNLAGYLDYNGDKAEGDNTWRMAQWGCTKDMATEGVFERNGSVLTYNDGGKLIKIDSSKTGAITLGIKGSEEYTKDENGNIRERTDSTENWPHILIEQSVNADTGNCEHLYMEVDYTVTKCESLVDRELYPVNNDLNAAQFQW